jgi:glutamine amidotransferase
MITIIDYGLGNILAIANVYKLANIPVRIAKCKDDVEKAERIILPGVGAFDYAMRRFRESGMKDIVDNLVKVDHVPVLGICVGMQLMANSSEEGVLPGLGWINSEVKKFDKDKLVEKTGLPHMGWNDYRVVRGRGLFKDLEQNAKSYFLHSYYIKCACDEDVLAYTEYGIEFASAVNHGNVFGVQFHPEKSHGYGSRLLINFAEM